MQPSMNEALGDTEKRGEGGSRKEVKKIRPVLLFLLPFQS